MHAELLVPEPPPLSLFTDYEVDLELEEQLRCGGMTYSWLDSLTFNMFAGTQRLAPASEVAFPLNFPTLATVGKPSGTALFLKSDVEKFDRDFGLEANDVPFHKMLQWWAYTLGVTCGMGLGYVDPGSDIQPHIRVHCLPPSQMRGAIGWMYGPPLARNRTMQLSRGVRAPYYRFRLLQHEGGHFEGHYGSPSHSNRREDIMYPTLQHIKAVGPRWGYSVADIAWAQKTFGPPWITE